MSDLLKSVLRKSLIEKTLYQPYPVSEKREKTKAVSFTPDTKEGSVDSDEEVSSVDYSDAKFSKKRTKSQAELDDYRRCGTSTWKSGKEEARASKAPKRAHHDEQEPEIVHDSEIVTPLTIRDLAIPAVPGQDSEKPKIWMLCHPGWFRKFPVWYFERYYLEAGMQEYQLDSLLRDLEKFSFNVDSFPASKSERFLKLFLQGKSGKARFWAFVVAGEEQEIFLWVTSPRVDVLFQVHPEHTPEQLVDLAAENPDYFLPPPPHKQGKMIIATELANVDACGRLRNEVGVHRPNWLGPTLKRLEEEFDSFIASDSGDIIRGSTDD